MQNGGGYSGPGSPHRTNGSAEPVSPSSIDLFAGSTTRRPHFCAPIDKRKTKQAEIAKKRHEDPEFREREKLRHLAPIADDLTDPDNMLVQTVRQAVAKRPKGDPLIGSSSSVVPVAPNDDEDILSLNDAEDTISFLSSKTSSNTSVKFVYLNRAKTQLRFRPYDLKVCAPRVFCLSWYIC